MPSPKVRKSKSKIKGAATAAPSSPIKRYLNPSPREAQIYVDSMVSPIKTGLKGNSKIHGHGEKKRKEIQEVYENYKKYNLGNIEIGQKLKISVQLMRSQETTKTTTDESAAFVHRQIHPSHIDDGRWKTDSKQSQSNIGNSININMVNHYFHKPEMDTTMQNHKTNYNEQNLIEV